MDVLAVGLVPGKRDGDWYGPAGYAARVEVSLVATVPEVESILHDCIRMLERVDPSHRAMLPSRRTIQASCPDLGLTYHAFWRNGQLSELYEGPPEGRADIRISVDSDDLVAMAEGELDPGRAFATDRVRIQASMTDLLRLRAIL